MATPAVITTPTSPEQKPALEPTKNRYMEINLKDEISSNNCWSTLYRVAAITSMVAFTAIAVVATILCSIYAPLYTPLVLIGTIFALKFFFYDTVYKWLDDKADVYGRHAEIAAGVLEKLEALEENITKTQQRITDIREGHLDYKHITENDYKLALARYDYWAEKAQTAGENVNKLRGRAVELNDTNTALRKICLENKDQESIPKTAFENRVTDKVMEELFPSEEKTDVTFKEVQKMISSNEGRINPTLFEAYAAEESKLLPSLFRAAFMLHVIKDPTDTREMDDFGCELVKNFADRAIRWETLNEDHAFFGVNGGNPNYYERDEIIRMQASHHEIQEEIFPAANYLNTV